MQTMAAGVPLAAVVVFFSCSQGVNHWQGKSPAAELVSCLCGCCIVDFLLCHAECSE